MAVSKSKKYFKLKVREVYEWGGVNYYSFRNFDEPESIDTYQYKGNAFNLREGKKLLIEGDIVEFYADYKTTQVFNLNKNRHCNNIWVSFPTKKKLIKHE